MNVVQCERQWRRCLTRRVRLSRVIAAAAGLLLLLLLLAAPRSPLGESPLQRLEGEETAEDLAAFREDLVAVADRQLPPIEGDGAAIFARLEAMLNDTESLCVSRATLGGWCLWCELVSVEEGEVFWKSGSDGSKELCLDHLPPAGGQRRCTVISVGINNDFSFDRAAARLGCHVHAFDPTMNRTDGWVDERLYFHGVGLAASAGEATFDGRPVPLDTLDGLLRRAQMTTGPIDYLKLDIESSEWTVLESLLSSGGGALRRVRQFTVEFHLYQWHPELNGHTKPALTADSARRILRLLHALRLVGFRLLATKPYKSCVPVAGGKCIPWIYETLWVNDSAPV